MHRHTLNCDHPVGAPLPEHPKPAPIPAYPREDPVTGTGENPLKALRVEPVISSPVTVEDYVKTVDFRFLALQRWIESGENRVALETIARIEGDLQQIRLLLKGAKKLVEG
jgi:hypothetical protein